MKRSRLMLPVLGFAVMLVVCVGILLTSVYNRTGNPESALRLSERELALPGGREPGPHENTPLTLHLAWRVESTDRFEPATTAASATRARWITPAMLAMLDIPVPPRDGPERFASALLVLEFAGAAHARAVTRACDATSPARDTRACELETDRSSRLFVIDAGRSLAQLRTRYPDRAHYAIVPGVIKVSRNSNADDVVGYVESLSVETVQAIEPLRSKIDTGTGEMAWHRLRSFTAVIAFGRRLEPWNVSVEERPSQATRPVLRFGDD